MKKKKTVDPDMPVGRLKRVRDFLPPPHELVISEETVKITILINKASVAFFKKQASKHGTKYQKMIREVLDRYAEEYRAA